MRIRMLAVGALLVASSSCGDTSAPRLGLRIGLSSQSVSLSRDTAITATLTNSARQNVYARITGTYVIFERREGTRWVEPTDWFVTDGIGLSFAIPPGEDLAATLQLGYLERPGEYRFRFLLYADAELKRPLRESDVASPTFVVVD